MSDARPARGPVGVDALSGLAALPASAREHALAEFCASRAGELAREARRVVRAHLVAPADRPAALDAVTTAQQALLRDVAAGHRSIDPRTWLPTLRAESARAVRRSAAQVSVVAPYRQRLAAQRANLLAVRETAADRVPPAVSPRPAVATVGSTGVASVVPPPSALTDGADVAPALKDPVGLATRRPAGSVGMPRHARRRPGTVLGHGMSPRKSLRWSAAALLSTVTIVVGAAVAPAEERPVDETGTSTVSFVDRLTMPIVGLWDNLVGNGKDENPDAVVPVPVDSPTTPAPAVQQTPAPTVPPPPVVPAVPVVPVPGAGPGAGTGGSQVPQEGGRHGTGGGWRDHDDLGRGEWHERDEDRDEDDDRDDDDDEQRGDRHGRDEQRGHGRGDGGRDDDRGNGHRNDRSDRSRGRGRSVSERRHGRASSVPRV
ncbi:hypothetical protein [Oerskovia sp. KBS0722]|uniref:hypothetical protein n=1 Tax=Oerskovia sp. KBS0722 TaxID=1179673 RepID=UPI00110F682D|nr:hypothetical protein [Oerskovia sp. KBS0722]QDW62473.1 hypothetical protein FFI11_007930 [Oerskovia sp. KBS0722]